MKKNIILIISVFMLMSIMPVSAQNDRLSDIEGHWAEKSIYNVMDEGIISGYPDGSFKPDNSITRAEFSKIVALAFDMKDEDINLLEEYNDIDVNAWYYPYVNKTAKYIPKYRLPVQYPCMQPYLNNAGGGFLPNSEAVRMHIAEALVKIKMERENIDIGIPEITIVQDELLNTFKDADYENLFVVHNGIPASNAVRMFEYTWLANELGIMQGDDNGFFYPYGYVTRAEIVTMIDRMIK